MRLPIMVEFLKASSDWVKHFVDIWYIRVRNWRALLNIKSDWNKENKQLFFAPVPFLPTKY